MTEQLTNQTDPRRTWPRRARFLPLVVLFLLLLGCTQSEGQDTVVRQVVMVQGEEVEVTRVVRRVLQVPVTVTPAAPEEERAILDLAMSGSPSFLDPQRASSSSEVDLVENLFVGLTRFNHATDSVEPELATEWEVSEDGLTWTFHLRDDIFWVRSGLQEPNTLLPSDSGPEPYRPVVADDVVYAIERACDPRTQTPDVLVLFIIEGCEEVHSMIEPAEEDLAAIGARAVDDETLEITLTKPASYLPTITSLWLMRPVPREVVSVFPPNDSSWAEPARVLSSGRFILGPDTVQDTRTVLVRNPYWPDPFGGTVDQVNIFWLDTEASYEMWQAKEVDISPLPGNREEEIMNDPRMLPRLHLISDQAVFYLAFNMDSEVFSDPVVRQAFAAAIDREALIEEVYAGRGVPMRHFSPPGVVGAPPVGEVGIGFSPDWAVQTMTESNLRDCSFLPPIRYLVSSTDLALHHAETLRSMWSRTLGCPEENIEIEQVQFGTLLANTRADAGAARPDIWDLGWASYFPDAHNWLGDVLHCSESENRQNRACSQVDTLIEQAATTESLEERRALYREAEALLFGEGGSYPIVPLFTQAQYRLIHPWLTFEPANFGGEQYDTYNLDPVTKRLERQQ
jgi:oligopeptide transport system substrate-binding protein